MAKNTHKSRKLKPPKAPKSTDYRVSFNRLDLSLGLWACTGELDYHRDFTEDEKATLLSLDGSDHLQWEFIIGQIEKEIGKVSNVKK